MARDQGLDDQIDSDEELLNFDLDDLSLLEDSGEETDTEEEMIELVDLVERGASEDITRDLEVREWSASEGKKRGQKKAEAPPDDAEKMVTEEEPDLDLSDISLEMDAGAEGDKVAPMFSGDEITEADLEGLLQEEEGITLDLKEGEGIEIQEKSEDEITETDLQALLSESGEQALEEEAEEEGPLEIISDEEVEDMEMEPLEETQVLDLKAAPEENLLAEEPADILAREAEELGAAAALEEEEAAPVEEAEVSEQEEEAEAEALLGLAEERVPEGVEEEEEEEEEEETFAEQALAGISEERLEAMIRSVVGEVVERVARETMTEVAERMIGEAIEALKQNLESSEP